MSFPTTPQRRARRAGAIAALVLIFTIMACAVTPSGSGTDPALQQTQVAVGIEQTMAAQQAQQGVQGTLDAQQATLAAQAVQATQLAQPAATQAQPAEPTVDTVATQVAQGAAQTQAAQPTAVPPTEAPPPTAAPDLDALMENAKILLYEDMIGYLDTNRYVKDTLDRMELKYEDVGSAKGWLKTQLLSKGPDGKGWDVVIIAAEAKSGVSGEFFEYVQEALNDGASVILEVWYFDSTHAGTASTLLSKCGIEFEKNWKDVPPSREIMFPLDASHPILQEPNGGLRFTASTEYWAYTYDIGDWMKLTGRGDATLLVGTIATEKSTHGTVTVCMEDRLIIQTFSSHQLTFDTMEPVWENYIYNALRARFTGAQ